MASRAEAIFWQKSGCIHELGHEVKALLRVQAAFQRYGHSGSKAGTGGIIHQAAGKRKFPGDRPKLYASFCGAGQIEKTDSQKKEENQKDKGIPPKSVSKVKNARCGSAHFHSELLKDLVKNRHDFYDQHKEDRREPCPA